MQYHKYDNTYKMGIDIGSTTVKVVLTDEKNEIAFARYRRHFSEIKKTVKDILKEAKEVRKSFCVRCVLMVSPCCALP